MRINERFSVAGAAGVLGLVVVLGVFGFVSLLGADPRQPLNSLGSLEEEVVSRRNSDEKSSSGAPASSQTGTAPATGQESPQPHRPFPEASPSPTPLPAAVLAAVAPGETRPTPAPGQPQPTSAQPSTPVPTPQVTPQVTPNPTPPPTVPPLTPTPQPDVCSTGGAPLIRETGKHVQLEFATVVSFVGDVLAVDVNGTVTVLHLTPSTVVTGNLSAATLVRAEGHREVDGSVTAETVEVLCPDWAR